MSTFFQQNFSNCDLSDCTFLKVPSVSTGNVLVYRTILYTRIMSLSDIYKILLFIFLLQYKLLQLKL